MAPSYQRAPNHWRVLWLYVGTFLAFCQLMFYLSHFYIRQHRWWKPQDHRTFLVCFLNAGVLRIHQGRETYDKQATVIHLLFLWQSVMNDVHFEISRCYRKNRVHGRFLWSGLHSIFIFIFILNCIHFERSNLPARWHWYLKEKYGFKQKMEERMFL